jgi:hypothetical protein
MRAGSVDGAAASAVLGGDHQAEDQIVEPSTSGNPSSFEAGNQETKLVNGVPWEVVSEHL